MQHLSLSSTEVWEMLVSRLQVHRAPYRTCFYIQGSQVVMQAVAQGSAFMPGQQHTYAQPAVGYRMGQVFREEHVYHIGQLLSVGLMYLAAPFQPFVKYLHLPTADASEHVAHHVVITHFLVHVVGAGFA